MNPLPHMVVSTFISGIYFFITKDFSAALCSFGAGILIDLDHLIDYVRHRGFSLKGTLREFYQTFTENQLPTYILLFHSLELVILLWIGVAVSENKRWLLSIAIGMTQHIIFDQIFNTRFIFAYFIIYRWRKGFTARLWDL